MADPFVFALQSPEETRERCQKYFDSLARTKWVEVYDPSILNADGTKGAKVYKEVPDDPRIPGVAGLAVALGVNRFTLLNWLKRADAEDENIRAIAHVIAQAKAQIEAAQEAALFDKEAHRGAAFSLAVNYKWGAADTPGSGQPFQRNIIPPAAEEELKAIPKWEPET